MTQQKVPQECPCKHHRSKAFCLLALRMIPTASSKHREALIVRSAHPSSKVLERLIEQNMHCAASLSSPSPCMDTHLPTFEFGGHTNLAGLTLLDVWVSLVLYVFFPGRLAIEICCIFVQESVQICLQSSKIRPPNLNVYKCAKKVLIVICHPEM